MGDYTNNIRIYDGDQIYVSRTNNPNLDFFKASKSNINPKFMNVLVSGGLMLLD